MCMQILGREVGNFYTRSELKHLIQIHVENSEHPVGHYTHASCTSELVPVPSTTSVPAVHAGRQQYMLE